MGKRADSYRLALIVEGNEEVNFMKIVEAYSSIVPGIEIEVINAEGVGNIPALFDAYYRDLSYDRVYCLLDVDNWKTECYEIATGKLHAILGKEPDEEALFNNPNSLQLLLSPFVDEVMERSDKEGYSRLIHEAFPKMKGVYRASKAQLNAIFKAYSRPAYLKMLRKTASYSLNPHDLPASSFAPFLRKLEASFER